MEQSIYVICALGMAESKDKRISDAEDSAQDRLSGSTMGETI